MFHVKHAYLSGLHYEIECSLKIQVSLAKSGAGFGSALADKIPNRIRGVSSWLRSVQSERSIFNTGFSWLQSWEECAKQTRLQHRFKALSWRLSLRRIAKLREGRRTECVAQLARDQRSRFTGCSAPPNTSRQERQDVLKLSGDCNASLRRAGYWFIHRL